MARPFDANGFNKFLRAANNPARRPQEREQFLKKASDMINNADKSAKKSLEQATKNLNKVAQSFSNTYQKFSNNVRTANEVISDTLDRVAGLTGKDNDAVNKIMADAMAEAKANKRHEEIERQLNALKVPTHDPAVSRKKDNSSMPKTTDTAKSSPTQSNVGKPPPHQSRPPINPTPKTAPPPPAPRTVAPKPTTTTTRSTPMGPVKSSKSIPAQKARSATVPQSTAAQRAAAQRANRANVLAKMKLQLEKMKEGLGRYKETSDTLRSVHKALTQARDGDKPTPPRNGPRR